MSVESERKKLPLSIPSNKLESAALPDVVKAPISPAVNVRVPIDVITPSVT